MDKEAQKKINNMGAITQSEVEKFAAHCIRAMGLDGWEMEWTRAGSLCERNRKIIFIDKCVIGKYPWQAKECVLHELAHINTEEDRTHGGGFYAHYIDLLNKFVVGEELGYRKLPNKTPRLLSDKEIRNIWKRIYDQYSKSWDEIYGMKEAGRDIAQTQREADIKWFKGKEL